MRKMTNEEFISKSRDIHGNKYDYSLTNYVNMKSKVKIIVDLLINLDHISHVIIG